MPNFQQIVDALSRKGTKDSNEVAKAFSAIAKDRKEQAAMDKAIETCSIKVHEGQIPQSEFFSCVPAEFSNEMSKPNRLAINYTGPSTA